MAALVFLGGCPSVTWAADPVATDASYTVEPGSSKTVTLAATDSDGDTLSYIITTPLPTLGSVTVGGVTLASGDLPYTIPGNGKSLTFTANSNAHGDAAIKFKANDGGADSNAATVTVTVNLAPVAASTTTFITPPNTDLQFNLPATDPDEDTLSYTITSLPGHGSLQVSSTTLTDSDIPYDVSAAAVTYSPDANYHGQDTVTFTATDGTATSASITSTIEVNTAPVPSALQYTVVPNGTVSIELAATDADKDTVSFVISSLPDHATLTLAGQAILESELPLTLSAGIDTLVYQVDANYSGTDTFHYRVSDSVSTSDRAVVTIYVNTPAIATSATYTVLQNTCVTGTLSPTDADGDALTIRLTRLGIHGTLKLGDSTVSDTTSTYAVSSGGLSFTYILETDYEGEDSFAWVANDGLEDSSAATVTINVLAVASSTPDDPTVSDPSTDTPTTEEPNTNQDEQSSTDSTETDAAAPACGPIGGAVMLMTAVWCLVITPRSRIWRRFADRNFD